MNKENLSHCMGIFEFLEKLKNYETKGGDN